MFVFVFADASKDYPGYFDGTVVTPGYKSELGLTKKQIEESKAQAAANAPLGRSGMPQEIAAVVLFLASDAAPLHRSVLVTLIS